MAARMFGSYLFWRLLPSLILLVWLCLGAYRWYQRHQARRRLEQEGWLRPRSPLVAIPTAMMLAAAIGALLIVLTFYSDNVMAIGILLLAGTAVAVFRHVRGDAAISQAQGWMAEGNTRAAVECLEAAIAESATARRWAVLADCHGVRGDHRRAAECYGKAQALDDERLDYAARQVLHLQLDGRWEEAERELAAWRQQHPEQMAFALLACRQYLKAGQMQFASEQLRQAMELAQIAGLEQRSHIPGLLEECAEALRGYMGPRGFEVQTTPPPPPPVQR